MKQLFSIMKLTIKPRFFLLSILILCGEKKTFSQNYKEDIAAIYSTLRSPSYHVNLKYRLFLDNNLKNEFQSRNIEISRVKNQVYLKQNNGVEVLDVPQYQILVDHQRKIFSVNQKSDGQNDEKALTMVNEFFHTRLDTFLMVFKKISVLENSPFRTKYECIYKDNPKLVKMIVVVNRKQMMFESVTTVYKDPVDVPELDKKKHTVTVELTYKDFTANKAINIDLFRVSKFIVTDKNGKFKPLEKFSDYKLLSNINTK
jgi:hypothetical protein